MPLGDCCHLSPVHTYAVSGGGGGGMMVRGEAMMMMGVKVMVVRQ